MKAGVLGLREKWHQEARTKYTPIVILCPDMKMDEL